MNTITQSPVEKIPDAPQINYASPATNWRRLFGLRERGVYYALLLLIAVITLLTSYLGQSNYLSVLNLSNVVYQSSLMAIMAVAMTVVLISGNFDLSVASVAALAAVILIGNADAIGFIPAAALAMAVAMAIGLINGSIVQFLGINAFIVTLGTMTAVRGLVLIYTDGRSLSASDPDVIATMKAFEGGRHDGFWLIVAGGVLLLALGAIGLARTLSNKAPMRPSSIGMTIGGIALLLLAWASGGELTLRNPVIYLAIFTTIVWFTLTFTMVGRRVYAVGGNSEAARLSGINVLLYKLMAFVFCSGAAGFAGILFASRLRSINPAGLQGAELTVIAAAILGGTSLFGGAGSVIKTLAGALLLFSLTNGFNILNLGANWQGLIEGIVVVVAAAIYTVGGNKSKSKTGG
ncbi:ABC transporter permease (plasmid) [Rhizobium leguminosarum]|uniref:Permease component of ABC transporter n=1 Tax=Rhizobium johnstonii (strain DSM 114642 / LMG 32736 / 3841) TaxID=216596 RepID=Q1M6M0_RHIJ3|nr:MULTISPECIES: ABC transporter permease [Rhizobium]NEI90090.1 ABC transporter permease [Rhizobium leguminosarum]NEJ79530.1 ABC transporter permease [Rhizobium leguminosarum]TBF26416.1 ABC transporter permease [Rhizobium leguminosarum]TBF69400.1 ABC transporter permease [Rhizobium leguminosarum]TBF87006.1 ABC transporter permease [Rhizobium leguminosarum]